MAYTGEGTQDNPYCVDTFEDFLTCINKYGAYVKVTADIDANREEKYQSATGMIRFQAAEIYADELTEISNFIALDSECFRRTASGTTNIRNIDFKNVIFKPDNNGNIFSGAARDCYLDFHDCKLSIQTVSGNISLSVGENTNFDRCAVSIECLHEGYGTSYVEIFNGKFTANDSIFEIINFPVSGISNALFEGDFSYCTLKISVCSPGRLSDSEISIFGSDSHDNVLILSISHDDSDETEEIFNVLGAFTAVDAEASAGSAFTSSSGTLYQLTTAQIKSESHLREIGFIP